MNKLLQKLINSTFKNPETAKKIFKISILIGIFFIALKAPVDPDMFWHLKSGELMWQYQTIPRADWYSYTMSDYPYVDFEWLTEILMFLIWKISGVGGLAVLFALLITTTFGILLPKSITKAPFYLTYFMAIGGAYVSSHTFGARPQMLSHFGLTLLLFIIAKYRENERSKIVWVLPLIFLLWANLHGGFVLGIGFMIFFLALEKFLIAQKKSRPGGEWLKLYNPLSLKSWKKLAYSFALSLPLTFLNPYGWRMYLEVYKATTDQFDKNNIMEWLAPNFHTTDGLIFGFYVIFIIIVIMLFKKIDLFSFSVIPLVLFFAFQAVRNIPFFVILTIPFLIRSLSELENIFYDLMNKKFIALAAAGMLIIFLPINNGVANTIKTFHNPAKLAEIGEYPAQALEFFLNNPDYQGKNIFNFYAWGGYMIGNDECSFDSSQDKQMPPNNKKMRCELKVFIDGRMSYWKINEQQILKDYTDIENLSDDWEKLIDKYRIQVLFLNKKTALAKSLKFNNDWKKEYEDDLTVIYEKNNSNPVFIIRQEW